MSHKVQRNDPCPCGSGKKYKKCCMLKEKGLAAERVDHREGIRKSLGWISHNFRPQIDAWVEDVWLADIDQEERRGIATADPKIRGIHDINLLEYLVAEGTFADMEGESKPLQLILNAGELQLDSGQRDYLQQLTRNPLRLYRVAACAPGKSFTLESVPSDGTDHVTIEDKWASRMFDVGDVAGMRLMQSGGQWESSGAIYHIPEEYVETIQEELEAAEASDYARVLIRFWLKLVAAHA